MNEMTSDEILSKFDLINDIRHKMVQLLDVKKKIFDEIQKKNHEEKCLLEYKHELELLNQEKMSHVEELRVIHGDINLIESVIKDSEENVQKLNGNAFRLHNEYLPLKMEIDQMSKEYFGMEPLPNLGDEEDSPIPPNFFKIISEKTSNCYSLTKNLNQTITSTASSSGTSITSTFLHVTQPQIRLMNKSDTVTLPHSPQPSTSSITPSFRSDFVNLRQQPPPMKSCLSCHQQIHRNAPICPLCKAKSRSRNPKKPKKKDI